MVLADALQRRVRPHKEDDQGLENYDDSSEKSIDESEGVSDAAEDEELQSAESQDESTV